MQRVLHINDLLFSVWLLGAISEDVAVVAGPLLQLRSWGMSLVRQLFLPRDLKTDSLRSTS